MKCSIQGCDEPVYVQIIDWENNWESFCDQHALKEINNPTPRDA